MMPHSSLRLSAIGYGVGKGGAGGQVGPPHSSNGWIVFGLLAHLIDGRVVVHGVVVEAVVLQPVVPVVEVRLGQAGGHRGARTGQQPVDTELTLISFNHLLVLGHLNGFEVEYWESGGGRRERSPSDKAFRYWRWSRLCWRWDMSGVWYLSYLSSPAQAIFQDNLNF